MFKNLHIINELGKPVDCKLHYDKLGDMTIADRLNMKSDKLKLDFFGGDPMTFNANITINQIKNLTDSENSIFNFIFKTDDFLNVKKLSVSDKDNDVFYINAAETDGKNVVTIGESSWNMMLSEIEYNDNKTMAFPKKYFKTIGGSIDPTVYIFDTYLVVSTENSDLLISSEITV